MPRRISQKRRFAALFGVALLVGSIGYSASTSPGIDWAQVIAITVAGVFATALAALTLWLLGRPFIGWYFDRRTSS